MTPNATARALLAVAPRIFVINLEDRSDRRREMRAELGRIGLGDDAPEVRFFRAYRPEAAGAFPSIGAHGAFMSHLGVLRQARAGGCRAVLILEDDAAFTQLFVEKGAALLTALSRDENWSMAYLGHRIAASEMPGPEGGPAEGWHLLDPQVPVVCAHALLLRGDVLAPLVEYLERMLTRPAGHADGGPMHVDGAYSWFRRTHPDIQTWVSGQQNIIQRASRSDIAVPTWKENLPFLPALRALKNRLSNWR